MITGIVARAGIDGAALQEVTHNLAPFRVICLAGEKNRLRLTVSGDRNAWGLGTPWMLPDGFHYYRRCVLNLHAVEEAP